jgi:hypothetical protein
VGRELLALQMTALESWEALPPKVQALPPEMRTHGGVHQLHNVTSFQSCRSNDEVPSWVVSE